jgi:hypothetical protein
MGGLFSATSSFEQPRTISITQLERAVEKSKHTSLRIPEKITRKQFVDFVASKNSYRKHDVKLEVRQLEQICATYSGDNVEDIDLNQLLVGLAFFSHGRDAMEVNSAVSSNNDDNARIGTPNRPESKARRRSMASLSTYDPATNRLAHLKGQFIFRICLLYFHGGRAVQGEETMTKEELYIMVEMIMRAILTILHRSNETLELWKQKAKEMDESTGPHRLIPFDPNVDVNAMLLWARTHEPYLQDLSLEYDITEEAHRLIDAIILTSGKHLVTEKKLSLSCDELLSALAVGQPFVYQMLAQGHCVHRAPTLEVHPPFHNHVSPYARFSINFPDTNTTLHLFEPLSACRMETSSRRTCQGS